MEPIFTPQLIHMMRLVIFFLSSTLITLAAQAQSTPTAPEKADTALYLRFPFVPPFNLYKVPDSTLFTKADLKKKKATLLMVFSPDCDHCQHETKELTDKIKLFKKVQIVMASWLPYDQVKQFYKDYHIADYPNITMGWDKAFMLPSYYKFQSLPFMALYDKKGNLISVFEGSVSLDKVAAAFE
jgi:thioredoxin-related protein